MQRIITTLLFAILMQLFSGEVAATSAAVASEPPAVQMTQPSSTVTFYSLTDSLIVKGVASDSDGIAEVRLLVNGQLLASDFVAPYEFLLQGSAFTTYNLQLEAVDSHGATNRSAVRAVQYIRVNDDLTANIQVVTGTNILLKSSNLEATFQKGEPQHAGVPGGKSVWFAWRPSVNSLFGTVVIDTFGSEFDTVLAIYTNRPQGAITNLTLIAANDNDAPDQPFSRVKFTAHSGTTYYIAVDGRDGLAGEVRLNILLHRSFAPVNDFLAYAMRVPGMVKGSNTGASKEPEEPDHAGNRGGASLWYRFDGAANSLYRITTAGSSFDTTIAIYTNVIFSPQIVPTMENLRLVAENDDAPTATDRTSEIFFTPRTSGPFWIAVDGYDGAEGSINLSAGRYIPTQLPPNDMFARATEIFGSAALTNVNTLRATSEQGDPLLTPNYPYLMRSVWYRWIARSNAPVLLSTRFSDFDTIMGVYTGTNLHKLSLIAFNDDDPTGSQTSALIFNAIAGTTYHIDIAGFQGASGDLVFALNQAAFHLPRILTQQLPGRFILTVADIQGSALLESSSDLREWTAVQIITPGEQPIEILADPLLPQQFYRVRTGE